MSLFRMSRESRSSSHSIKHLPALTKDFDIEHLMSPSACQERPENVIRSRGCILTTIKGDWLASIFIICTRSDSFLWADSRCSDNKRTLQLIVPDRRQSLSSALHDIRRRTRHHPKIPVDARTIEREDRLILTERYIVEVSSTSRWTRRSW